jgi:hypothetical protein
LIAESSIIVHCDLELTRQCTSIEGPNMAPKQEDLILIVI